MAAAAPSTTPWGFVFRLLPFETLIPPDQSRINTCVVDCLTWIAGRVDPSVKKLSDSITTVWTQNPRVDHLDATVAMDLMHTPIQEFAKGTEQSVKEVYKEELYKHVIGFTCADIGLTPSELPPNLQKMSDEISAKYDSQISKMEPADCVLTHLQTKHPEWTKEECSRVGIDISITSLVYPLLVARQFGIQQTEWKPTDSYGTFIQFLEKGPLLVTGAFGEDHYTTAPEPYGHLKILNLPVLKWPKGAARQEHSVTHVVILVGVIQTKGAHELVLVQDPAKPRRFTVISYDNLKRSVKVLIPPSRDEHAPYTTYALQDPNGTLPREPLT